MPILSSCSEARVCTSLVFHTGLVLCTARARPSRPEVAGVHLECHPCSNRILSQSSWVQRGRLALRAALAPHTALGQALRSTPLARHRCTTPLETRTPLLALKGCSPPEEFVRHTLPSSRDVLHDRSWCGTQLELARRTFPLKQDVLYQRSGRGICCWRLSCVTDR